MEGQAVHESYMHLKMEFTGEKEQPFELLGVLFLAGSSELDEVLIPVQQSDDLVLVFGHVPEIIE